MDARFAEFKSGGLKTAEGWLSVAKTVPISQFHRGETYSLKIETNEKGYKTVVGIADELPTTSPIPSIPKTKVQDTPAPGGVSPVAKAVDNNGEKGLGKRLAETMSKADWAQKDLNIERLSIVGRVAGSAAYAQLVVGKKEQEAFEIGGRMVDFFLAKLDSLKG